MLTGIVLLVLSTAVFRAAVSRAGHASKPLGRWQDAPDLAAIRGATSAVVLGDGRVVVAGGGIGAIPLAGTEVFDPKTGMWSRSGDLLEARRGHAMVPLDDGRVLIAGGVAGDRVLSSVEIYDPTTGAWTATAPMRDGRLSPTLTPLPNGRVLAAGGTGADGRSLSSAEVYDRRSASWTAVPTGMLTARSDAAAVALNDGRVLITGGVDVAGADPSVLASAELFDPVADVFTRTGDMGQARQDLSATRLADGRVLAAGGATATASLATAEIFDPARGDWTPTHPMAHSRRLQAATLLPNGMVLVSGGESLQAGSRTALVSAEVFDPDKQGWTSAAPMHCPRSAPAQVTLRDGRALVAGGDAAFPGTPPSAQSCTELFEVARSG